MSSGQMASDANYPSNTGVQIPGASQLTGFQLQRVVAVMTIAGTIGSGSPSYKMQTLNRDSQVSAWIDVPNTTLTAVGQVTAEVVGEAVRVVAANGTSPGTGANTPRFTLNCYDIPTGDPVSMGYPL